MSAVPIRLIREKASARLKVGNRHLRIHNGDLLHLEADAVVCPVPSRVEAKSGLAKIILHTAGKDVLDHLPVFPEPLGKVVVMPAGELNARYLFLAVALGGADAESTRQAVSDTVSRAIRYAEFLRLKTIAFPVLGSAQEATPYNLIAREMLAAVTQYLARRVNKVEAILFSAYNTNAFEAFCEEAGQLSTP